MRERRGERGGGERERTEEEREEWTDRRPEGGLLEYPLSVSGLRRNERRKEGKSEK